MKTAIITIILATILFAGMLILMGSSLEAQEIHECHLWQNQAKQHPNYYLLKWQKEQCDYHNIKINAPIK